MKVEGDKSRIGRRAEGLCSPFTGPRYNGRAERTIGLKVASSAHAGGTEQSTATARQEEGARIAKGLLAGAAGGLLGAWAMIRFAEAWGRVAGTESTRLGTQEEMDVASNVVDIVTRRVLHSKLRRPQRARAAEGFHCAFGTLVGAAYGVLAELAPAATTGAGAPFGALEWLVGIKLTLPKAGLLKERGKYPKQERVQTFAAHVVYGLTAELVRSSLRREPQRADGVR